MKIRTVVLAMAATMAAAGAQAADNVGKAYLVATIGQSKTDLGDDETYYSQRAAMYNAIPGVTANTDVEDASVAYAIGGGYRVHKHLAVEGYYRNFGTPEAGVYATDYVNYVDESSEYEATGLGVGIIGLLPVNEAFSLYARADLVNIKTEVEVIVASSFMGTTTVSGDDTKLKVGFGVGAQFDLANGFSVRADFQRIEAETELAGTSAKTDIDSLNLGLVKAF